VLVAASRVPDAPIENNRVARCFGDEMRRAGLHRALPALPPGPRVAAWLMITLGLVIGLPWLAVDDPQGLGFRLRVVAFVPLATCAAIVAGAGLALIRRGVRSAFDRLGVACDRTATRIAGGAVVAVAVVLAVHVPGNRTEGEVLAHPALVSAIVALEHHVPDTDTIIVPERHIAFMVAWYTRADVSLRPEPIPHDRRWRLMPLAFIGAGSALDKSLLDARREPSLMPPVGLHPRHPNGLVLVREDTWDWVFAHLPADEQRRLAAWPTL
jgi:hypothetical protein